MLYSPCRRPGETLADGLNVSHADRMLRSLTVRPGCYEGCDCFGESRKWLGKRYHDARVATPHASPAWGSRLLSWRYTRQSRRRHTDGAGCGADRFDPRSRFVEQSPQCAAAFTNSDATRPRIARAACVAAPALAAAERGGSPARASSASRPDGSDSTVVATCAASTTSDRLPRRHHRARLSGSPRRPARARRHGGIARPGESALLFWGQSRRRTRLLLRKQSRGTATRVEVTPRLAGGVLLPFASIT